MHNGNLVLLIFGFVLTFLAGLGMPYPMGQPRAWNLGWLGVACVIAAQIFVNWGK